MMDFSQIKDLIQLIQTSNISEFELKQKDFSVLIRTDKYVKAAKALPVATAPVAAPEVIVQQAPAVANPPKTEPAPVVQQAPAETPAPAKVEEKKANYLEVKSPMVGTFYRSASPEKPPFVKVGDTVNPDSVLCLIEAMKLFNEVRAEVSGRVVKVMVDNTAPVEYDQVLFLIEPA